MSLKTNIKRMNNNTKKTRIMILSKFKVKKNKKNKKKIYRAKYLMKCKNLKPKMSLR